MRVDLSEANAAMARLARNNVVGLRHLADSRQSLMEEAFQRFVAICRPGGSQECARRFFRTNMIGVLQQARLTVNFSANKIFGNGNEPVFYSSMFERAQKPTHDPETIHDLRYRNRAEMEFCDYAGRKKPAVPSRRVRAARQLVAHYGATGIGGAGLPTSNTFERLVRPRYGALDFAYCRGGGAGGNGYGRSFMVLMEYVKHASTYCHTDSFKVNTDLARRKNEYGGRSIGLHDAIATYFELEKVLLYCTPSMLMHIYAYASGQRQRGSPFCLPPDAAVATDPKKGTKINYIEFQAHTDFRFDRDVAAMYICRDEIRETMLGLVPWYETEHHIREFARKRNIRLAFF
jgi:hypothetical protein